MHIILTFLIDFKIFAYGSYITQQKQNFLKWKIILKLFNSCDQLVLQDKMSMMS